MNQLKSTFQTPFKHTNWKDDLRVEGLRKKLCDEIFCFCLMYMQCSLLAIFEWLLLKKWCLNRHASICMLLRVGVLSYPLFHIQTIFEQLLLASSKQWGICPENREMWNRQQASADSMSPWLISQEVTPVHHLSQCHRCSISEQTLQVQHP